MLSITQRFTGVIPQRLQTIADYSATLARILAGRGIIEPNSLDIQLAKLLPASDLKGLNQAVKLIDTAIDNGKKILIVGDFDCDGATSTALMVRVLREMGGKVEFLVPDRFKYGYGLTPEIVTLGIQQYQPDVIVTVDNGISSHAGVNLAKQHGITVIITDHHLTTKAIPNADAVVNPNQLGCPFASKALVGVGVAFYILGNLAKIRRQANKKSTQVSRYFDLVALGTVADVGIFDQNNRILVFHGLQTIRQQTCCLGILALLQQARKEPATINAQDLGFIIGPRINAAGRMDNMRIGIECLLADDWETATILAHQLDKLNRERRQVETHIRQQADNILQQNNLLPVNQYFHHQQRSIILYQDDWHQGVIGIVAGRLKENYHLPTIVFAPADTNAIGDDDAIKGSARSIAGIHIRDAIETVAETYPELISHFGGHAMAAGLTIKKRHYQQFCQAFNQVMAKVASEVFQETLLSDGELSANEFNLEFLETLQNLTIWGHGFVPPVFDGIFTIQNFRLLKETHLKLWLSRPDINFILEAIWFNADLSTTDLTILQKNISKIHLLYELEANHFNQQTKLQLRVKKASFINK